MPSIHRLVLAMMAFCGVADAADACSVVLHEVFFDVGSADARSPQQVDTIAKFVRISQPDLRKLAPTCERIVVSGFADTAEAAVAGNRIDVNRAETIRDALVNGGVPKDWIETKGMKGTLRIETGPGVREPQNRNAVAAWVWRSGRYRCDPASKKAGPPACLEGEYRACYLELTDGTVCNFDNVPDPNPQKYSVVVRGH